MKKKSDFCRIGKVAIAVAATLGSLAWAQAPEPGFADMLARFAPTLAQQSAGAFPGQPSEVQAKTTLAVQAMQRMDWVAASKAINEALQLDARNAHLHFLNGFVYQLQARQGDTEKNEMAIEGYRQALRIDPANWIAREFLGLVYMDLKKFGPAKEEFTQVLLLAPESTVSLYGLMVAAYLTGDAPTACAMADQFKKASAVQPAGFMRSGVAVYAACGAFDKADQQLLQWRAQSREPAEVVRVEQRLARWKSFYSQQALRTPAAYGVPMQLAQAFAAPKAGSAPAAAATPAVPAASAKFPSSAPSPAIPERPRAASVPDDDSAGGPRMVLVDVVLLSTQELASTSKGINLLSALTLQLGSSSAPAYSEVYSASNSAASVSTAITRAVTVPALTYSLNIANANSSVNEVLARPTLAAIEGMPSEFFSGTNLSAGVVSVSPQGGTTIVPLDKRFGVKLAVTPTFLASGKIQLKVEAQRTSLNANSDNPKVAYQVEIAETTANANVVMRMGDTLVLSGLSERSASSTRDGVPLLQDIPVLQYLFSNKKTNSVQRSVLILITPRAPEFTAQAEAGAGEGSRALREKFGLPDTTPANVDAVLQQLGTRDFFREFRQGDVSMERWEHTQSTGERLLQALEFLYY